MHHRWCYKLNMHIVYILLYKGWKKRFHYKTFYTKWLKEFHYWSGCFTVLNNLPSYLLKRFWQIFIVPLVFGSHHLMLSLWQSNPGRGHPSGWNEPLIIIWPHHMENTLAYLTLFLKNKTKKKLVSLKSSCNSCVHHF